MQSVNVGWVKQLLSRFKIQTVIVDFGSSYTRVVKDGELIWEGGSGSLLDEATGKLEKIGLSSQSNFFSSTINSKIQSVSQKIHAVPVKSGTLVDSRLAVKVVQRILRLQPKNRPSFLDFIFSRYQVWVLVSPEWFPAQRAHFL